MKNRQLSILITEIINIIIFLFNFFLNFLPSIFKRIYLKIFLKNFTPNTFFESNIFIRNPRYLEIGKNCSINYSRFFHNSLKNKESIIKIGNNVTLSPNVKIYSATRN